WKASDFPDLLFLSKATEIGKSLETNSSRIGSLNGIRKIAKIQKVSWMDRTPFVLAVWFK
ncbi:hypothetical protein LD39_05930, partial [Halobacillus sp. BBL2006]